MLSVGSVGVRPLTQPSKIAFKGKSDDDDLEDQKKGVDELRDMANSSDTPAALKKAATGAFLVGVGALGFATFNSCAPKAWDSLKKGYEKAVTPKTKVAIAENIKKGTDIAKKYFKKVDAFVLDKATKALEKAKPDSRKSKIINKALTTRKSAGVLAEKAVKWAKADGPKWLKKTMAVATGGASAVEAHQEITEMRESKDD